MNRNLKIILIIGLALRLGFLLLIHPWTSTVDEQLGVQNDSPLYHRLAVNLLEHGEFNSDGSGEPAFLKTEPVPGEKDDLRTPVYPLFLAAIYGIFGVVPWIPVLIQLLLDVLACYILYRALQIGFTENVALIGSLFYAIDPFVIIYGCFILTESLFLFLLIVTFYIFVRRVVKAAPGKEWSGYLLVGLLLGIATLTRPIAQFVFILLIGYIFWTLRKRLFSAVASAAVLTIMFLLTISPWLIRNHQTFDAATLTYIGAYDLLVFNTAAMEAPQRGISYDDAGRELLAEADSVMRADGKNPQTMNRLQKAPYWQSLAVSYALHDPISYGIKHLQGCIFVYINLGSSEFANAFHLPSYSMTSKTDNFIDAIGVFFANKSAAEILISIVILLYLLVSYGLGFTGLAVGWRKHKIALLVFCLLMAVYFVGVVGALGNARLKLPTIPFLVPFMGIGYAWLSSKFNLPRPAADSD